MWAFYFFAFVLVLLGVSSLKGGLEFLRYVRGEMEKEKSDFTPLACVIAPCRGLDQGLEENVRALFMQDYPTYGIIFVTDSADDPALDVVEKVRKDFASSGSISSRVCVAGEARESGQKVHNLRAAVKEINPDSRVLVFVDTDARPHASWLRSLIAPLLDESVGAATGYRWFIPVHGGFSSQMRSVWNASIASALGARRDKNFCWGGATAIRRETFERLRMRERWRGTLSDDFALTRALQQERLPIHFVPDCLTASLEDCNFRELLEFTTRQLKITRVYAAHLWKAVLGGSALFVLIFFGGILLVATRALQHKPVLVPIIFLVTVYLLGTAKSYVRLKAVSMPLAQHARELRRSAFAHLFLWPLATLIYLYNAIAAALSRKIVWRGLTYELRSPTKTVIAHSASQKEMAATTRTQDYYE
ncbi:MAG TPA: glycosyltransferase family 2 protein [Pyrinomonadaceae bacterium]|nr:glycosyltransferase family 2 protein [Pyrinomonadaceae bacterium]